MVIIIFSLRRNMPPLEKNWAGWRTMATKSAIRNLGGLHLDGHVTIEPVHFLPLAPVA
jgi:hypothetical protein